MKIKWGSLVTDGSGKIGGHVAASNRSGSYLRTKVTPTNPQSTYQTEARSRFASISSAWRGLTDAQRSSFTSAVSDYATTDVFGDLKNPSGSNLFQRLNNNLLQIDESMLTTCPAISEINTMESLSIEVANGAGTFTLTFSPAIEATEKFKVLATPAVSAGKSFVKSEYRQIGVLDSEDLTGIDIATMYTDRFGSIGAAGLKVFVKLVPVSVACGLEGTGLQASAIISA